MNRKPIDWEWTPERDKVLYEMRDRTNVQVAHALDAPYTEVNQRRCKLNLTIAHTQWLSDVKDAHTIFIEVLGGKSIRNAAKTLGFTNSVATRLFWSFVRTAKHNLDVNSPAKNAPAVQGIRQHAEAWIFAASQTLAEPLREHVQVSPPKSLFQHLDENYFYIDVDTFAEYCRELGACDRTGQELEEWVLENWSTERFQLGFSKKPMVTAKRIAKIDACIVSFKADGVAR